MDRRVTPEPDIYTHGHQDAVLRSHRWRTAENSAAYLLARLRPGDSLLDIGCGPGTLTIDLARVVSPGTVVGIDIAGPVVAEASARAAAGGVTNVTFLTGDFRDAGLDPASFEVVHAHQVLQHLHDPVTAMATMTRLAKSGGTVAARDSDYGAFSWSPTTLELDRWREIYSAVARRNGAEPDAGRRLLSWAHAAGWPEAIYSASTWTFAAADDRSWWSGLWAERCTDSSFAQQAVSYGLSSPRELEVIARHWLAWGEDPDAVFVVVHGEVLSKV
jgi:SAM-dependent methyltransferase